MNGQKLSIKALQKEIRRLKRIVHRDQLTNLYNRSGFTENINAVLNELKGEHKKGNKNRRSFKIGDLSVVFADLNNLKKFNDEYGHACGDEAIKAFAKLLKEGIRSTDIACRWSGDEFVLVLMGADKKAAQKAVEKIKKMMLEKSWKTCLPAGRSVAKQINVSASFGIASVLDEARRPKQVFELKDLIHEADKKMYEDKKHQKSLI